MRHSTTVISQRKRSFLMLRSIGLALTDTLDDLISEERIHPQLAMKILGNFDQAITEALQKNVKSRLQFKVNANTLQLTRGLLEFYVELWVTDECYPNREAWIHTDSATKSGLSSSRT